MRRRVAPVGSLTSMLDVLFILVFAALVQSSAQGQPPPAPATAEAAPVPSPPAPPAFVALRAAAVAQTAAQVERAPLVVARVEADGTLAAIELADARRPVGVPLLEQVADLDVGLAYLGDRAPALQVCGAVARELGLASLDGHVVVIAPTRALAELPVALVAGLRRDVTRCQREQHALAVIVEPGAVPAPAVAPVGVAP